MQSNVWKDSFSEMTGYIVTSFLPGSSRRPQLHSNGCRTLLHVLTVGRTLLLQSASFTAAGEVSHPVQTCSLHASSHSAKVSVVRRRPRCHLHVWPTATSSALGFDLCGRHSMYAHWTAWTTWLQINKISYVCKCVYCACWLNVWSKTDNGNKNSHHDIGVICLEQSATVSTHRDFSLCFSPFA